MYAGAHDPSVGWTYQDEGAAMSNWYGILAWASLVPILGYQHKRWLDLAQPPKRGVQLSDLFRYFWLIVIWPLTDALLVAIGILHGTGNTEQLAKANAHFDSISGLGRRINESDGGAAFYVPPSSPSDPTPTLAGSPPEPGWWLASDGRWYPPPSDPATPSVEPPAPTSTA